MVFYNGIVYIGRTFIFMVMKGQTQQDPNGNVDIYSKPGGLDLANNSTIAQQLSSTKLIAPSDYEHIYRKGKIPNLPVAKNQTQVSDGQLSNFVLNYITDFINRQERTYSQANGQYREQGMDYTKSSIRMRKPSAIILNIESTITDRNFISRTLFPFFRNNVGHFFKKTYSNPTTGQMIDRLRAAQVGLNKDTTGVHHLNKRPMLIPSRDELDAKNIAKRCANFVHYLYEHRRDSVELKELRLLMWVWAIENNLLLGHVFEDVAQSMNLWKFKNKIRIFVHSSAITLIQKLLLVHCNNGNLLFLVDDFLDHKFGAKLDSDTYSRIATSLYLDPNDIVYITDHLQEGHCASQAGLEVAIIQRNKSELHQKNKSCKKFSFISSLDDVYFMK